jgi:hypothetical protein
MFTALCDPAGIAGHRRGALERTHLVMTDWQESQRRVAGTETKMVTVLDELELTGLVTSITSLSAIGAAAILAQTGDLRRFASGRAVVKHAGLAPREQISGSYTGRTKMTGQGQSGLRLAAWRAVWGAQRGNPVYAARYQHLTTREQNKLTPTQAQAVITAAPLRHLHAIITTGRAWLQARVRGSKQGRIRDRRLAPEENGDRVHRRCPVTDVRLPLIQDDQAEGEERQEGTQEEPSCGAEDDTGRRARPPLPSRRSSGVSAAIVRLLPGPSPVTWRTQACLRASSR